VHEVPQASEILRGLTSIANEAIAMAIVWHAIVGFALIAILAGWRPTELVVAGLLVLPLISVSVFASTYGNPFNGGVFAIAAVALAAFARRLPAATARPVVAGWQRLLGASLIAFGWLYPHFLDASLLYYAVAAPLGLVPCPTLALVVGATLVGLAHRSSAWSTAVGLLGVFLWFGGRSVSWRRDRSSPPDRVGGTAHCEPTPAQESRAPSEQAQPLRETSPRSFGGG
jgi:hypothetical protein